MNERIRELAEQAKKYALDAMIKITDKEQALKVYSETYDTKFAELIVRECDQLNQKQSFELTGVVVDVEQGDGFDSVCLDTVKRVESDLADSTLKKHFGVEE